MERDRNSDYSQIKRKKRQPKPKPGEILIRPKKGETYTEILREIRSKAEPEDTETDIKTVSQTRAGDVLLKLGAKAKNTENLSAALKTILRAEVTTRSIESWRSG